MQQPRKEAELGVRHRDRERKRARNQSTADARSWAEAGRRLDEEGEESDGEEDGLVCVGE